MVREAEAHAEEDRRKREEAEVRNQASSLIYATEKSLREVGDRLDAGARAEVENALNELKRVEQNGTAQDIRAAIDRLQQASYKMSELLYATAGAGGGDGTSGAADGAQQSGAQRERRTTTGETSSAPSGDVIDAEFKESK
jgi:molecular chaperone DnaK